METTAKKTVMDLEERKCVKCQSEHPQKAKYHSIVISATWEKREKESKNKKCENM
jgi:hypothetical protein